MTLLIAAFLVSVGSSFFFSILEATILSVTHAHIELLVQRKKRGAKLLKRLKNNVEQALAAILTVSTLSNVFGPTVVAAQARELWGEAVAAGITLAMAGAILVMCEILPKVIGARHWKVLAIPTAYAVQGLIYVAYPAVVALRVVSRLLSREEYAAGVTREEMMVLAEMGGQHGTLPKRETQVIANLLRLNLVRARDVMTPRVELFALQKDLTAGAVIKQHQPLPYSRIPVYAKNRDHIVGMVMRNTLLEACLRGEQDVKLDRLKGAIHAVPEHKSLASLLEEYIHRHEHMFLVVNEFGGTEGVVTLEDVIESLLGVEINDEMDSIERLRKLAIQRMEMRKSNDSARAR